MQLWDYRYSHCIGMYKGHESTISSLKYSPDGLWIASGDEDGSVKVSNYFLIILIFIYFNRMMGPTEHAHIFLNFTLVNCRSCLYISIFNNNFGMYYCKIL